jgi:hypothetical protein
MVERGSWRGSSNSGITKLTDPIGAPSTVITIKISGDGSSVAWVEDRYDSNTPKSPGSQKAGEQFLHYAVRKEIWEQAAPLKLSSHIQNGILALSADGKILGTVIQDASGKGKIHLFMAPSATSKDLIPAPQPLPVLDHQVISLALTSFGETQVVAAGTAEGSILWYVNGKMETYAGPNAPRSSEDHSWWSLLRPFRFLGALQGASTGSSWEEWRAVKHDESGSAGGPTSGINVARAFSSAVTDVAFLEDPNTPKAVRLLAARADQSIWLFPIKDRFFSLDLSPNRPVAERAGNYLAVNELGNAFATYAANSAAFFSFDGERLTKGLTLQEPDNSIILGIALSSPSEAITSVMAGESLEKTTHHLSPDVHLRTICDNQPYWTLVAAECEEFK